MAELRDEPRHFIRDMNGEERPVINPDWRHSTITRLAIEHENGQVVHVSLFKREPVWIDSKLEFVVWQEV